MNILWIVTDEHRSDSLGCYGSPIADTPNIDRLGTEGVLFERAFCQAPVCAPSRAAFKTGKYCSTLGMFNNTMGLNIGPWHRAQLRDAVRRLGADVWSKRVAASRSRIQRGWDEYTYPVPEILTDLAARVETARQLVLELGLDEQGPRHRMFPELLAEHGYQTINIGKLHHQGPVDGFEENPIVPGSGVLSAWGWRKDLRAPEPADIVRLPGGGMLLAGTCPVSAEKTPEALYTDTALRYLCDPALLHAPFLLRVSYLWPHTPVLVPEPYNTMYDPREFAAGTVGEDELRGHPRFISGRRLRVLENPPLSAAQIQLARAHYQGLVSFIDHEIGRLLAGLAASPFAEDTLVIFHADHGALHGEHGLWQKDCFYDPVAQVPLIIRLPAKAHAGRRIGVPVQLIDIAPTLLQACGIDAPADMEGADLGPVMRGEVALPHEYVFSEIAAYDQIGDDGVPPEPRTVRRMVHDGRWRLEADIPIDSLYGPDGALYDTAEDPHEAQNRFYDLAARRRAQEMIDVAREFANRPAARQS